MGFYDSWNEWRENQAGWDDNDIWLTEEDGGKELSPEEQKYWEDRKQYYENLNKEKDAQHQAEIDAARKAKKERIAKKAAQEAAFWAKREKGADKNGGGGGKGKSGATFGVPDWAQEPEVLLERERSGKIHPALQIGEQAIQKAIALKYQREDKAKQEQRRRERKAEEAAMRARQRARRDREREFLRGLYLKYLDQRLKEENMRQQAYHQRKLGLQKLLTPIV